MNIIGAIIAFVVAGLVTLAGLIVLSFLLAWPVYALWNECLVGAVDGVHAVTWLQAWGISVLCAMLFKGSSKTSTKSSD